MAVPVYSKTRNGGDLLILGGYEYVRTYEWRHDNRWRCRMRPKCCATLDMDEVVATLHSHHTHEPVVRSEQQEPAAHAEKFPPKSSVVKMVSLPKKKSPKASAYRTKAPPKRSDLTGQTMQSSGSPQMEFPLRLFPPVVAHSSKSVPGDTQQSVAGSAKVRATSGFSGDIKRDVGAESVQRNAKRTTKSAPDHRSSLTDPPLPPIPRLPRLAATPVPDPSCLADAVPLPAPKGNNIAVAVTVGTDAAETFGN
ncbi:uncharacterized protein LOC129586645 [Paramacrobiotus metropolitanus]|uniref:uncharacterized protein LOC129586645 n=1 Tax=Paramacrobiotus metropolitanus TaxID=2943436 RepID=UPI0024459C79|nr:uncharacterized protein LOC129586645 [Paramacrobiotus metropolitanus]